MYGICSHRLYLIKGAATGSGMNINRRHLGLSLRVSRHLKVNTKKMKPALQSTHPSFMGRYLEL
jgi:hypothetical protein